MGSMLRTQWALWLSISAWAFLGTCREKTNTQQQRRTHTHSSFLRPCSLRPRSALSCRMISPALTLASYNPHVRKEMRSFRFGWWSGCSWARDYYKIYSLEQIHNLVLCFKCDVTSSWLINTTLSHSTDSCICLLQMISLHESNMCSLWNFEVECLSKLHGFIPLARLQVMNLKQLNLEQVN